MRLHASVHGGDASRDLRHSLLRLALKSPPRVPHEHVHGKVQLGFSDKDKDKGFI